MKSFINVLPRFFAAFAISVMIIASFAAVSVLGDDGKALNYNRESGTFTVFGEEYRISPQFISAAKAVYGFNGTFLGNNAKRAVDDMLLFCVEYATNAFSMVYGISEAIINNCA